ncbi:MAG TPA: hypothetical protein VFA52_02680 [Candidatus Paceibacterota bacterium]|nr:hypothetical protein [Candidatus Paceibacterota bacterium]
MSSLESEPNIIEAAIKDISSAIIEKNNSDGFENQNDIQNFIFEQFQKHFPSKATDLYSSISWDDEKLCIMSFCDFARSERSPEKESYRLINWDSSLFERALRDFILEK